MLQYRVGLSQSKISVNICIFFNINSLFIDLWYLFKFHSHTHIISYDKCLSYIILTKVVINLSNTRCTNGGRVIFFSWKPYNLRKIHFSLKKIHLAISYYPRNQLALTLKRNIPAIDSTTLWEMKPSKSCPGTYWYLYRHVNGPLTNTNINKLTDLYFFLANTPMCYVLFKLILGGAKFGIFILLLGKL